MELWNRMWLQNTPTRENMPITIDFKNNYGTAGNNNDNTANKNRGQPCTPSSNYTLHGQGNHVELRGHCHHQRKEGVDVKARKKLIIASILCLFFMVAEIIGGILSNSLAIATDAAHLLTDFASFMISLFAIWLAGRPSTQRLSFGWYRAEVIGAMASVTMIWVITGILVWLAIQRVITGHYEVNAEIMLITSVLAIVVNLIMGFQLHHSHSHGGGGAAHSHLDDQVPQNNSNRRGSSKTLPETPTSTAPSRPSRALAETNLTTNKRTYSYRNSNSIDTTPQSEPIALYSEKGEMENMNVRAAFIHVLGDVLQSVGVFVAALVIYFKPEWAIADPICTFVFSVIVLCTTFAIMKDALLVLMEGTPTYMDYAEVMDVFLKIEGVKRVHNLRIWALSINKVALSAHLAVVPGANPKKILQEATTAVHLKYNIFETTIQIEDFTPEMENCQQCTVPAAK